MKSSKKLLSIILAVLMICAAIPAGAVSAEDTADVTLPTDPYPALEYTQEFYDAVNYKFFFNKKNGIEVNSTNFKDYITVYKSDAMVVFKVVPATYEPSRQLIDGYMFYADPASDTERRDVGYYIYLPGHEKYDSIYSIGYAVNMGFIEVEELAKLIPGTKKMTEQDYIDHIKSFGYDVTYIVDLGDNIFYAANENTMKQEAKDVDLVDITFHVNTASLQNVGETGLLYVAGDYVYPVTKLSVYGIDSLNLLDNIRKAEKEGKKLGFTAEYKYGEKGEECLRLLKEDCEYHPSGIFVNHIQGYWEIDDFCLFRASTGAETCEYYQIHIGNYLFHCGSQTVPYDLGLYVVRNGECYYLEDAYSEKVINDEDMDKIVEAYNDRFTLKLTPLELEFVNSRNADRKCNFGNNTAKENILLQVGETDDWKLYYAYYKEGKGITNYGDYKITWGDGEWDYPLGLYIYKDGRFITFEQAWQNGVINSDNIGAAVDMISDRIAELGSIKITRPDGSVIPTQPPTNMDIPTTAPPTQTVEPVVTNPATESTEPTEPQTTAPTVVKAKKANTIKVTAKTVTVKAKKLKKGKLTVKALTVKNAKGKVTYKKLSGSKKLTVTKKGKITVKKGTKKGTYIIKVKITAKGNSQYLEKSVAKMVKVRVK